MRGKMLVELPGTGNIWKVVAAQAMKRIKF